MQASILASHLHLLLQREKRTFKSQITDQIVKIQCLKAADKELKEEVVKITSRIHELEEEEIRRAEETRARIRELKAEIT